MDVVNAILLILAGILAVSGLILAKKPDAKAMIDKLVPFQAVIGVAILAMGLYNLFRSLSALMDVFKIGALLGVAIWGYLLSSILLGFLFGMPQIAKWIPGDSPAEQKAMEFSKKVAPFQTLLGIIGIASALIYLLYRFQILKP